MKKTLFILPLTIFTFACASDYNAVNLVTDGEVFVGETVENIGRSGSFTLLSPDGVSCEGEYNFKTELTGSGTMTCSNEKTGFFVFSSEKIKEDKYLIKGYGRFSDKTKFTITFGEVAPQSINVSQNQSGQMPAQYRGQTGEPYSGQWNIKLH